VHAQSREALYIWPALYISGCCWRSKILASHRCNLYSLKNWSADLRLDSWCRCWFFVSMEWCCSEPDSVACVSKLIFFWSIVSRKKNWKSEIFEWWRIKRFDLMEWVYFWVCWCSKILASHRCRFLFFASSRRPQVGQYMFTSDWGRRNFRISSQVKVNQDSLACAEEKGGQFLSSNALLLRTIISRQL
jgi:hypothetical protein